MAQARPKFKYTKDEIQEMAALGALHRYRELLEEAEALLRRFPKVRELLDAQMKDGLRLAATPLANATLSPAAPHKAKTAKTSNRKPLTAKQKREIGERMRKYWAERRKAVKGGKAKPKAKAAKSSALAPDLHAAEA